MIKLMRDSLLRFHALLQIQNRNALQIQCMMGNSSPKRERMMRNAKPQQETKNKCKAVELHVDARDSQAGLAAFDLGGEWLV
jgi:hypothetical protein